MLHAPENGRCMDEKNTKKLLHDVLSTCEKNTKKHTYESNMMKAIWWKQYGESNVMKAIWWKQYDESNMVNQTGKNNTIKHCVMLWPFVKSKRWNIFLENNIIKVLMKTMQCLHADGSSRYICAIVYTSTKQYNKSTDENNAMLTCRWVLALLELHL